SGPIQQWAAIPPVASIAEANSRFEDGWLRDSDAMSMSREQLRTVLYMRNERIEAGNSAPRDLASDRAVQCLMQRRLAQLDGGRHTSGAVDGRPKPLTALASGVSQNTRPNAAD